MGIHVQLTAADGFVCPAYLAQPSGRPKAGLVVLQEIFGVNSHIRAVADGYAAQGYLAIAPQTFARAKPDVELGYSADDMKAGFDLKTQVEQLTPPGALQDIEAAVQYVAQAGKVGVVGYCWGGLMAWRSVCLLRGISACVPYYGGGVTTPGEVAREPLAPVMLHFAEKDHWIPLDTLVRFRQMQPQAQIHIYDADHGFNCDQRGSYNQVAAQLARERSLAFFEQHLSV